MKHNATNTFTTEARTGRKARHARITRPPADASRPRAGVDRASLPPTRGRGAPGAGTQPPARRADLAALWNEWCCRKGEIAGLEKKFKAATEAADQQAIDTAITQAGVANTDLERRLLATPATDLSDLALKVAVVADWVEGSELEHEEVKALVADLQRLLPLPQSGGTAPAPTVGDLASSSTDGPGLRDRVEDLALQAGAIVREFESGAARGQSNDGESWDVKMYRRLEPIWDEATSMAARSPRGALFQLMLAISDVSELRDIVFLEEADRRAVCNRTIRALASAIDHFEVAHGIDRATIAGEFFAPYRFPQALAFMELDMRPAGASLSGEGQGADNAGGRRGLSVGTQEAIGKPSVVSAPCIVAAIEHHRRTCQAYLENIWRSDVHNPRYASDTRENNVKIFEAVDAENEAALWTLVRARPASIDEVRARSAYLAGLEETFRPQQEQWLELMRSMA
ncbi:hypothetical protein BLTE_11430 [Blastochloris tepida]|uniref:Uncharacterized protein n=2 Tax=Blastochloris tepida TaxID=2233851 RepID=A0A348FYS5_9HYPH|nr:hypothetical protein BLTE_11430 [Blastochloris tepida]